MIEHFPNILYLLTSSIFRAGKCYEVEGHPDSPLCAECPEGRIGSRCELCEDGYFGDPEGLHGASRRECRKCECSRNIDMSAIGNCNRTTGECLQCIDDTAGFNCEKCKSGFFGDALAPKNLGDPKNCQPCQCNPFGTYHVDDLPECNSFTGLELLFLQKNIIFRNVPITGR